jgi:formamidopyrimidine-DNA glycosylase
VPELPEVETVRRTLAESVIGARVVGLWLSGLPLRMQRPVDARALGRVCKAAELVAARRRAKYLLLDFRAASGRPGTVLVHLGMSGRVLVKPATEARPRHTHVVWQLADGREIRFIDPRRFGMVRAFKAGEEAHAPELAELGVEPFGPEFTAAHLLARARRAHRPLKTFLLDQKAVVGVGNIYTSEALFVAGLHPHRLASKLTAEQAERLHDAIVRTLQQAIDHRGTSLSDYVDAFGETGFNQLSLAVYGRQGQACPRCGSKVSATVTQGRATFFCPACQRR